MSEYSFRERHLGPDENEVNEMLKTIGAKSVDELIDKTVPAGIRLKKELNLPPALSEKEFLEEIKIISLKNKVSKNFIGQGYYNTFTPPVILRNIFENPGWYTQYTPYQAEIAQGRLEMLLNFQTMVSELTGLEISNASLLDEATAAGEAMTLMYGSHSADAHSFFVSENVFAQTLDVILTRATPLGIKVVVGKEADVLKTENVFGMLLQYPAADGSVNDYRELISKAKAKGIRVAMATDLLALMLLESPGKLGADVAFGSAQRFGVPMGFGGPHAAFFAAKDEFKRSMPGRIIGVSVDAQGNRAFRMSLQTREQHIRREKATSNICTAQALLANMAAAYAIWHGPAGLKSIAERTHTMAANLAASLNAAGFGTTRNYFDTITVRNGKFGAGTIGKICDAAEKVRINFHRVDADSCCISVDETTGERELKEILNIFDTESGVNIPLVKNSSSTIPSSLLRKEEVLTHPVFSRHHSETKMMRYLSGLEKKDLALNTSMISLGSCTMKLNAAAEMMPLSWSHWSSMHPFAPDAQTAGYRQMVHQLEKYLCEITGFAACSLQPNSGAQGEYAGLLVMRAWHESRGEAHRNVILIPSSAHGTNPASAVMAGFKVVVTACDSQGNIDLTDLKKHADEHAKDLAGLMATYPSTHGVFEETIIEVCKIIHSHGGQVYMDGANMNAQVGLTSPAAIGADVNHINLHKTFSIPHGGGGPGMGPICVAAHLAPFLPGHAVVKTGGEKATHAVSAAPYGSASILLISYAYIRMLGAKGCTDATKYAILNANFMMWRLKDHYQELYRGKNGTCAHEFILDFRPFKQSAGVEVEDVAKRLMDYGFHAPTVSFPVAGTMMIEPTESEGKEEMDRFCDALISIREEIRAIENGEADKLDNVLKNAPHTAEVIAAAEWKHPYNRMQAAFPLSWVKHNKFWPSVSRINNTYGDRNLVCVCPPIEEYAQ